MDAVARIADFSNEETLALDFFSAEDIEGFPLAGRQTEDILEDYFSGFYPLTR